MEISDKEFNKKIGKAIQSIRITTPWGTSHKTRYMTQTKLSKIIGVTFQQVQKYEKGTNGCSAYRLLQIANAFKVSVGYIYHLALGRDYYVGSFQDDRFVKIAEIKLDMNDEIIIMEQPLILTNEVKENKKQN
tara:strand:+ start:180 stop:578 length:399 start_codon:yes stop_codon:yes gene_type:complete